MKSRHAPTAAELAAREARRLSLPVPSFDDALPVCQRREEIREAIAKHPVVIVAGETGSGKTTQLPKILLSLGRGVEGQIGHTQPRRLAARAVATRLAQELGTKVGEGVGYKVRFTDAVAPASHVKVMTDGILLAEIAHDRLLRRYDTLIIDEAHERSLNIDFLLGYLKRILPKRPDLKLVITSATIDHLRFAKHFADAGGNPAPVIEVSGRTFPVETVYRPTGEDTEERVLDLPQAVHSVLGEILAQEREHGRPPAGDVLVFCTGEREIREVHQFLRKAMPGLDILPLYARLSAAEQNRVFAPHGGRRIVLATNVAETSITVPNIGYVIDPGLARLSRYNARSRVQRLPVEAISQASANQRQGRCGRVAAGVCFRLYSEADFLSRPEYTDAEIRRTNLAAVILQMSALGLGAVEDFPFIDPPDRRYVQDGWRLLEELNAVDGEQRLTAIGRQLARLPVDPRLGRMLAEGARHGALAELLLIVSALAVQDPRERPHDRQQAADEAHAKYADKDSDFLWFVNAWRAIESARQEMSNAEFRRFAEKSFLSFLRLREWRETHHQLRLACTQAGWQENTEPADFVAVHRALLAGLLSQVFQREERTEGGGSSREREKPAPGAYVGTRSRRYAIWPGSALAKKGPAWGVAAEIVETQRTYARTVARVQPGWIEAQAQHLVRREHFDARWDGVRGMVMAREQVSLLGLVLHPGRDVHYGPLAPAEARELFIRGALVGGDWGSRVPNFAFIAHNAAVEAEVDRLEAKLRRRDVRIDDEALFRWFDARVPADVFSTRKFDDWYRRAVRQSTELLCLAPADLMSREPAALAPADFPDDAPLAGARLPLDYRFEPGEPADGANLDVPLPVLNQLSAADLDWLVPGLLKEKCIALVKSLPKEKRRALVPVPDVVAAVLPRLVPGTRPLVEALAEELRRVSRQDIRPSDFNLAAVSPHLRVNVRVHATDADGGRAAATPADAPLLDQDRDLDALRHRLGEAARQAAVAAVPGSLARDDVRDARFPPLPPMVETRQGLLTVRGFPALVDLGDRCAIRLFADEQAAAASHRLGLRRLFFLHASPLLRTQRRSLPGLAPASVHYRLFGTADELFEDVALAAMERVFLSAGEDIRDGEAFLARWNAQRPQLDDGLRRILAVVGESLAQAAAIRGRLLSLPAQFDAVRDDVRRHLDALLVPRFVAATPVAWLCEFPRYLRAIERRLERIGPRDEEYRRELDVLWRDYTAMQQRLASSGRQGAGLETYRWMLEEYRVSLFAQQLGTRLPVSAQRLARLRETLDA